MSDDPAVHVSDSDIALAMMAGDEDGLRMLLEVHGPKVYGFLIARHGVQVAEEAYNIGAWNAWRFADRYDESEGSLGNWFLRIAHNAALDIYKLEKRHRHKNLEYVADFDPAQADDEEDSEHRKLGMEAEKRRRALYKIIDRLPPLQKAIVLSDLAKGEPQDAALIAKELETSVNSVYVNRSKARKTIREEMVKRRLCQDPRSTK